MASSGRYRIFKGDLRNLAVLAAPVAFAAVYMIVRAFVSWHAPQNQPPYTPDPVVFLLCLLQGILGLGLLVSIGLLFTLNQGRVVTLSPDGVMVKSRDGEFAIRFKDAFVRFSPLDRRRFRTLWLSDGKRSVRVESFFFPEFELLERVVAKALDRELELPQRD